MTLEEKRPKVRPKNGLEIDTQSGDGGGKLAKTEYTFSSSPRALYNNRKMVTDVPPPYVNLMFEKRVFRGSNFSQGRCGGGEGEAAAARAADARRRVAARREAQRRQQQTRASHLRLGSPPAVAGRQHERVQTEVYLEELFVDPPVRDSCTQTDLFLERPASPFYVPAKTGADVATQIMPGDLFDFDMEVQPVLEVLVGKTIEQALVEVLEEEELAAMREQQRNFLEVRAAETAEAMRLEEREKRLAEEKRRRMRESELGLEAQHQMEQRIAAAVLVQGYMADLLPSVLEGLEADGHLADGVRKDLDDDFMPWLVREVTSELRDVVSSRDVLADIVRDILEDRAEVYQAMREAGPALDDAPADDEEEGGPTVEELLLRDHLRLQKDIGYDL